MLIQHLHLIREFSETYDYLLSVKILVKVLNDKYLLCLIFGLAKTFMQVFQERFTILGTFVLWM